MPILNTKTAQCLYNSTAIRDRVRLLALRVAAGVLAEASDVPFHTLRAAFAQQALADPDKAARRITLVGLATADLSEELVETITTAAAESLQALERGEIITTATLDALFLKLISTGWNTFAGIVANPVIDEPA